LRGVQVRKASEEAFKQIFPALLEELAPIFSLVLLVGSCVRKRTKGLKAVKFMRVPEGVVEQLLFRGENDERWLWGDTDVLVTDTARLQQIDSSIGWSLCVDVLSVGETHVLGLTMPHMCNAGNASLSHPTSY
jgi:hypothetical protein